MGSVFTFRNNADNAGNAGNVNNAMNEANGGIDNTDRRSDGY